MSTFADGFFLCVLQEVLMQLEKEERRAKLEETFQSVWKDYERIMEPLRLEQWQ